MTDLHLRVASFRRRGGLAVVLVRRLAVGRVLVGDVLAVVDDAAGGAELLVVGVLDDERMWTSWLRAPFCAAKCSDALGLGVGGEPVLAVDLLVVGGEGRLQVFVAGARVLGDGLAVDEDDLQVLLVDPDLALEVVLVLLDALMGPASKT
jgi:hypothetical protein